MRSHRGAGVAVPALHIEAPQDMLASGNVQLVRLVPSQRPPQSVPAPEHFWRAPRGSPVTAEHVPFLLSSPHASHGPAQALSQQTPSTQ
jgi:hypothetical protein